MTSPCCGSRRRQEGQRRSSSVTPATARSWASTSSAGITPVSPRSRWKPRYPGAQAMFVAGCGADQNPLPRTDDRTRPDVTATSWPRPVETWSSNPPMRPIESAARHGVRGNPLTSRGRYLHREQIEADAKSKDACGRQPRTEARCATLDGQGEARRRPTLTPCRSWKLDGLTWVFLGGEVVVDYSLRIKRNLGSSHTWVSGLLQRRDGLHPLAPGPQGGGLRGAQRP